MKRIIPWALATAVLSFAFPATCLADLSQTTTLSTSGQTNLNLDTGAVVSSGGDIQFSSAGITPQGAATAVNASTFTTANSFAGKTLLVVQLFPGYSSAVIPSATLKAADEFYVHTNGGHYSKVLVTAATGSTITLMLTTFGVTGGTTSGPPTITLIQNNSIRIAAGLPNYGIVPSSIFVIIGRA